MSGWLDGQAAVVVGGGSGIGRAVVEAFVVEGARVAAVDRDRARIEALTGSGLDVCGLVADASRWTEVAGAVDAAVTELGALDTLVCCVGVFDFFTPLERIAGEDLDAAFTEIFDVNVKSYLLAARACLPHLVATHGSIVLTLSTASLVTDCGGALYTATKWADRGLVASLAHELAPDVRVNGVAPGGTAATRLAGLRSLDQRTSVDHVADRDERLRVGSPLQITLDAADVAWAYVYLASASRARGVTGSVTSVDAGRAVAGRERLGGRLADGPYSSVPAGGHGAEELTRP